MGDSTTALMKLQPVTFLYRPEYAKRDRTLQYGLIAEEVAKVYPELAAYDSADQPYLASNAIQRSMEAVSPGGGAGSDYEYSAAEIATLKQHSYDSQAATAIQNGAMQERLSQLGEAPR